MRTFYIGPDRHGTRTITRLHECGTEVEIRNAKLPCPVVSRGTKDSLLNMLEKVVSEHPEEKIKQEFRAVLAYILRPTANG